MVSPVDAATSSLVGMALDAANLRQVSHASNIALAGTPGHVPTGVQFEAQLEAVRESLRTGRGLDAALLGSLQGAEVVPTGQAAVQLDQEVAAMSRDALHYQALVRLLNKHYATVGVAIDGGRR